MPTQQLAPATLSSDEMKALIVEEDSKRKLVNQYLDENLQCGVDFDKAHSQAKKPQLLKPGSEKIISLLNIEVKFCKDMETWEGLTEEMRGKTICYRCDLTDRKTGKWLAEGYGAYTLGEKDANICRSVNTGMKMACKRAQIDATLRLACLSDRFEQDTPLEPTGKDQTEDVIDAFNKCKTIAAYKIIVGNLNAGKYKIKEAARSMVMNKVKETRARVCGENPFCKCEGKDEPCEVCKTEIKDGENLEATLAK